MDQRQRLFSLIFIMAGVVTLVTGFAIYILYNEAIEQKKLDLQVMVSSQAKLLEAVAVFDQKNSEQGAQGKAWTATISQLRDAYDEKKGYQKTGELVAGHIRGDQIEFLLPGRKNNQQIPDPVDLKSTEAEPMRRALKGESGVLIGKDYVGEVVLAAHEPVKTLNIGLVAKIDLSEVRTPFIDAALLMGGFAFFCWGALISRSEKSAFPC